MTGKLICLEGIDGAGKTTLSKLIHERLSESKIDSVVTGERQSPISELIRNGRLKAMTPLEKVYAFAYDRAWAYVHVARPALEKGNIVLWDRYVLSALAYRQAEFALGIHEIEMATVRAVNTAFPSADYTLFLDIPPELAQMRHKATEDRVHLLAAVRAEYETLLCSIPHARIDATRDIASVCDDAVKEIRNQLQMS